MKLKDIEGLDILTGTSLHRMRKPAAAKDDSEPMQEIKTIPSAAIGSGHFIASKIGAENVMASAIDQSRLTKLDDVIFKTTPPFCSVYIYEKQYIGYYLTSSCIFCRFDDSAKQILSPAYLAGYMNMPPIQEKLLSTSIGASISFLKKTLLEQFDIPLLPIEEQNRLGDLYQACIALNLNYLEAQQAIEGVHEAAFSEALTVQP